MNIGKIAKRAKVSTATVSRTINGSDKVTPETAERVWRVVRSMGYQPNSYARALVSGKSRMLGLIISDIVNPFFPELVRSFEEIALENGYEVIVANTGYDLERMARGVNRMLERKAEGVAVITSEMGEDFVAQIAERRIPIVFLDTARVGAGISKIKVDYSQGINEAVQHIVGLGHKRIAFVSGPEELRSAETRRTAFLKCLRQYGVMPDENLIEHGNHRIDGGQSAMERLLALPHRPTAVLTSNDLTAMGVLRAIYKAKLRVPEDISVIGFDDIELSEFTHPALTTVRLSRKEVAEKAFEALATLISGKSEKGRQYDIETHLVVRDSTGPAAAAGSAGA
jgi:DNA-binding LacI/PurR family transcriptional regulator